MRTGAALAIASVLLISIVLVSSFVTGFVPGRELASPLPPSPQVSGSSPKTVVLEFATGTWCPPCAYADPAFGRIADEYDPSRLVVLAWHVAWGRSDPWDTPTTNARVNWYNINTMGVPAAVVDGGYNAGHWQIGAWGPTQGGPGRNYQELYRPMLDNEYAAGSNVVISVTGDLSPTTATVNATITATNPVSPIYPNLNVTFVLYEDSLYYMGSNGEPFHRGVVLDMKQHSGFTISQGETKWVNDSFNLRAESATYVRNKLGVAVLLQSHTRTPISIPGAGTGYGSEILNAARLDYVTPGIVTYREDTNADFTEPYEKLLSQANIPFHQWDNLTMGDTATVDNRGSPDAAGIAPYPMVAWFTRDLSSGTLTSYDQTILQDHLNAGGGALLVSGENLGAAIGSTAFYSDVLKASFGQDNSGSTTVMGFPGDPVSGAWATGALVVAGSSPDTVSAVGGGTPTFQYTSPMNGAAIRSDYDADSRVIYMGYRYFDGTDGQRMAVLQSAVGWFDADAGPMVTVGYPNGGEVFISGNYYRMTWSAKDIVIPATGVDLYYTADSGSPTWVLIAQNEPNDGVYTWNPPSGVDSDRCRLKVVVRDGQGNAREDISDADFTIGSPVQVPFSVILQPGTNLVSFPVQPSITVLTSVLSSIDPNFAWVRVYDARNPTDPWVTWTRNGPASELTNLDRTMGFWVEVTSATPVTLTVLGLQPSVTTIPLVAGWNLVGFPSGRTDFTVAMAKAAAGATMVSGFDGTSPTNLRVMADTEFLLAGNGYWVYVPANRDWVVTY